MGRSRGPLAAAADEDGAWFGHRSKRRRVTSGVDNSDPGSTGDGKRPPLYHCNYCRKDISGTIRIKCAKCPDYDLCVECFSVGAETYPHKGNHPYRVMDNLAFPLLNPDWNADEEILLLEAIEMCGVGNWGDVAEHVGTKRKLQCQEHYTAAYMDSPYSPLPDLTHVMGKSRAELLNIGKLHMEGKKTTAVAGDALRLVKQEPAISPARIKTEELAEGRSPSSLLGSKDGKLESDLGDAYSGQPSTTAKKVAVDGQAKDRLDTQGANGDEGHSNRSIGGKKPKPAGEDSSAGVTTSDQAGGFNPKRQEFDPVYDSEAENLCADMEFKDNNTETDRELKLRILHIYFSRLDERARRKDFVIDRGLIDSPKKQVNDRKRTNEEKELYQRARVFLRYLSNEDHDSLLRGLIAERTARRRIEELQEMRSAGCRSFAEGELYLLHKKRGSDAVVKKTKDSAAYAHPGGKATHRANRYMKREGDGEPSPSGEVRGNQKPRSGGHHSHNAGNVKSSKKFALIPDIAGYPGMDSLSQLEQDLCRNCKLHPKDYLRMKEELMAENVKRGQVRRSDAYGLFKIDPIKTDKVYELLLRMGWIQGENFFLDRK